MFTNHYLLLLDPLHAVKCHAEILLLLVVLLDGFAMRLTKNSSLLHSTASTLSGSTTGWKIFSIVLVMSAIPLFNVRCLCLIDSLSECINSILSSDLIFFFPFLSHDLHQIKVYSHVMSIYSTM